MIKRYRCANLDGIMLLRRPDEDAFELRGIDPETRQYVAIVIRPKDAHRIHRELSQFGAERWTDEDIAQQAEAARKLDESNRARREGAT